MTRYIPGSGPGRSWRQVLAAERSRVWLPAVILFVLDGLYLLGNVVHLTSNDPTEPITPFSAPLWDGNNDGSYIELFGHTQLLAGAVMLLFLAVTRRSSSFAVWTIILLTLVLDDFLLLHEKGGAVLVNRFALPAVAGLRPQDLGEFVVWGALAGTLGCALLATYVVAPESERRDTRALFGWVCLLVVFAVGLDQLHIVIEPHLGYLAALALTLLETAGELIGMTLIVLAIHRIILQSTTSPAEGSSSAQRAGPASVRARSRLSSNVISG